MPNNDEALHNDTVTVSFSPSVHPLHSSSSVSNTSFPSPPYSPLQWEEWASHSESSIVVLATGTGHFGIINGCLSTEPYSTNGYSILEAPGKETSGGGMTVLPAQDGTTATPPSILMPTVHLPGLDTKDLLGTETLIPSIASIQDHTQSTNMLSHSSFSNPTNSNAFSNMSTQDHAHISFGNPTNSVLPNASSLDNVHLSHTSFSNPAYIVLPNVSTLGNEHLSHNSITNSILPNVSTLGNDLQSNLTPLSARGIQQFHNSDLKDHLCDVAPAPTIDNNDHFPVPKPLDADEEVLDNLLCLDTGGYWWWSRCLLPWESATLMNLPTGFETSRTLFLTKKCP
ncbi:hypothetical protein EDD22DRAFT_955811 [Suillus occidentalis]|nr:hypothetical protein EDD22DRAFT_955811 [Suillus occidentalis]